MISHWISLTRIQDIHHDLARTTFYKTDHIFNYWNSFKMDPTCIYNFILSFMYDFCMYILSKHLKDHLVTRVSDEKCL